MTVPASPQINAEAISAYVEMVFGYLEGFVPIRVLAETGTPDRPPKVAYHRIADLAEALSWMAAKAADDSRGLYVVPGTVEQPGSARAADVIQTGVLVVDLDTGDIDAAVAHLDEHVGPPTLDVASGGTTEAGQTKRHLYWKLTEAASGDDLERIRALRETLAAKVGGDSAFKSLHQPIRVPGTIHGKNGVKAPVRLLARTARECELDDLEAAVEAMPALVKEEDAATASCGIDARPSARALMSKPIREGGQDEVSRFEALSSVIGHWVRAARLGTCSLEEAWTSVRDYNVAIIRPPWDEARLRREFGALHWKDQAAHTDVPARGAPSEGLVAQSEDALAAEFVSVHGDRWRFVAAWGAWQGWTGTHWMRDEAGAVHEDIRLICRAAARRCVKPHEARRLASDKTIKSVGRIVSTDPAIATRSGDWDTCPMLLNTPAGTIDLETGETLPHRPDELLSQITAVAPGGTCPGWLAFLDEITGGDSALEAYLCRLAGYCLTGSTAEQVFAFLHGAGANGKSVFLQTIGAVLGDYAATATLDTFMATRGERHLTELAGLRAARLVMVPETESGRTWAEARIKTVTGGEKIRANYMRCDHFEYRPQFKLVVAGNHKPSLTGYGEAMRRRLHLVPFDVTIPEARRDGALQERLLRDEGPGILAWMLQGCAEWRRTGLMPPERVRAAASDYFDQEDVVGQWIDECCAVGPACSSPAKALFASWSAWAIAAGHAVGSTKSLGAALRDRGFNDGKIAGARAWFGIAPKAAPGREAAP